MNSALRWLQRVDRAPLTRMYIVAPPAHTTCHFLLPKSPGGERRWGRSSRQLLLALRTTHRSRWKDGRFAVEMRTRMRLAWTQRAWTVQTQWLHWNQARSLDERGRAVSLRWRNLGRRVRSVIQMSTFWTDSYRSRIYEYEYDLPGTVSFRPLYGRGARLSTGRYAMEGLRMVVPLPAAARSTVATPYRRFHRVGCGLTRCGRLDSLVASRSILPIC